MITNVYFRQVFEELLCCDIKNTTDVKCLHKKLAWIEKIILEKSTLRRVIKQRKKLISQQLNDRTTSLQKKMTKSEKALPKSGGDLKKVAPRCVL